MMAQPTNAGDKGSIPDPERSQMPQSNEGRAPQLLRLCSRAQEPQLLKPVYPGAYALQQKATTMKSLHTPTRVAHVC